MSILNKLSSVIGRKDDVPNQEFAKQLAETKDDNAISEIADNLFNNDKKIQSDCIKVLYEIGYINPELIKKFAPVFLQALKSRNNRLVWGAMIGLSTIAHLEHDIIIKNFLLLKNIIETGSVITVDAGIKTLSIVASINDEYNQLIFPFLLNQLQFCKPKQVPMYSEIILIAVDECNKTEYLNILSNRIEILTDSQKKRVNKCISRLK